MRKFVGLVNGKSFDNEKDFQKAASEAMKDNDGNLSISSYYSYTSDEEKEEPKQIADDGVVNTSEYVLADNKTPDKVNSEMFEFNVSEELAKRLQNASNKAEIRRTAIEFVTDLTNDISTTEKDIDTLQKQIETLQGKMYECEIQNKRNLGCKKYYNTILELVEQKEEEKKEEYVKPEVSVKTIRELFGLDDNTSFSSLLRQFGLLK